MARRKSFNSNGSGAHCKYCNRTLTSSHKPWKGTSATRDHVKPKADGGIGRVWCCKACNELKGNMPAHVWFGWIKTVTQWWLIWEDKTKLRAFCSFRDRFKQFPTFN